MEHSTARIRRKKTSAERREQRTRAFARHMCFILKLEKSLGHRGSAPSGAFTELMASHRNTTTSGTVEPKVCWFGALCRYGDQCRFLHPARERHCSICGDAGHNMRTCPLKHETQSGPSEPSWMSARLQCTARGGVGEGANRKVPGALATLEHGTGNPDAVIRGKRFTHKQPHHDVLEVPMEAESSVATASDFQVATQSDADDYNVPALDGDTSILVVCNWSELDDSTIFSLSPDYSVSDVFDLVSDTMGLDCNSYALSVNRTPVHDSVLTNTAIRDHAIWVGAGLLYDGVNYPAGWIAEFCFSSPDLPNG